MENDEKFKSSIVCRGVAALMLTFLLTTSYALEPVDLDGVWFKAVRSTKGYCQENGTDLIADNHIEKGYLLLTYTVEPTYQGAFIFPDTSGGWYVDDVEISLVMGTINTGVLRIAPDLLQQNIEEAVYFARISGKELDGVFKNAGFKSMVGFERSDEVDDTCVVAGKLTAKSVPWEKVPVEVVSEIQ